MDVFGLGLSGFHVLEALCVKDLGGVLVGIPTKGGVAAVIGDGRRFELEGARGILALCGWPRLGVVGTEGMWSG